MTRPLAFALLLALIAPGAPAADRPAPAAAAAGRSKPAARAPVAPPAAAAAKPAKPATFSFVCATGTVALPPKVKEIATRLASEHRRDGAIPWGDRAVALRLRQGNAPTYFVPLACGTTGSCSWGIVAANPAKSLGVVSGAVLSVETAAASWPALQVYTTGSGQTRVETLRLSQGQYRPRPAERAAPEVIERLRSCFDNASCCPRLQ